MAKKEKEEQVFVHRVTKRGVTTEFIETRSEMNERARLARENKLGIKKVKHDGKLE